MVGRAEDAGSEPRGGCRSILTHPFALRLPLISPTGRSCRRPLALALQESDTFQYFHVTFVNKEKHHQGYTSGELG